MIIKQNFSLKKVFINVRFEMILTLSVSIIVYILYTNGILRIHLPFYVAGILGSGLAIFIAFRNQSSYSRWWEARILWGNLLSGSRIFARQIKSSVNISLKNGKVLKGQSEIFIKEMIYRQIAFAHLLRLLLRGQTDISEIRNLISDEEYHDLTEKQNKPNYILLTQGNRIRESIYNEFLGPFDNISIEPVLASFNNIQASCERIKDTPLPANYRYFTKIFLNSFNIILPVCLIDDFTGLGIGLWIIPVSCFISFVFSVMNRVGEINENPFENQIQDVPMTYLCSTIERDLKTMIGENNLPEIVKPYNGYLY